MSRYVIPQLIPRRIKSKQRVGFIGLGNMGYPIAKRLTRNYDLIGYDKINRNGIKMSNDIDQIMKCGYIITCLPNSNIVENIFNKNHRNIDRNSTWIDLTSGDPNITRELSQKAEFNFMDCGISGGPKGAQNGTLTCLVGGDEITYNDILPILKEFSSDQFYVGKSGSGHAVKSINNTLLGMNLWIVAEALMILKKQGIDPKIALDAINKSSGRSFVSERRYPDHIMNGKFDYGFSYNLLKKDILTTQSLTGQSYNPIIARFFQLIKVINADPFLKLEDHTEIIKIIEAWSNEKLL